MLTEIEISSLLNHYQADFSTVEITALGCGHINKTYKLTTLHKAFVLQEINHSIFPKTIELFNNTEHINLHLIQQKNAGNYSLSVPKQILTKTNHPYCKMGNSYWRLMEFVDQSTTIESVDSVEKAKQVASAFAHFSCALSDFNANKLTVMIEDFHNINVRLAQLSQAVAKRPTRLAHCKALVEFCLAQNDFITLVNDASKQLPVRVTHNDTKINNLLFNNTNEPCAVIDLDTCMPGFLMYDFGDMVRTCCSNLAEDDSNINNMHLKLDILQALNQSYQAGFAGRMTKAEIISLDIGAKLLPFMVGVRFLTDYLNGDKYFATVRASQNLDRANNQLHLYKLICQAIKTSP